MDRPHIRFDGRTLTPVAAGWPHAQNDAWGYLLWFVARLLRREHVLLTDDTLKALSLIVDYLGAIRYWEDEDNGHWEETAKIEASSIGTVVAGLRELQALLDRKPEHAARFEMLPRSITSERLGKLQAEGWEALDGLLPKESERRPYDAALLFLIYPLRLLDGKRARKICRRTRRHLSGSHGICRYRGDTFWSPDYDALPAHLRTAPQQERIAYFESMGLDPLRNGGEAQWCLFDPILSIIHADRALTARTAWGRWWNTRRHQRHLERALEQLARASESWQTLRCPELFYRKDGGWVPNDIQGLNWTAANLRLALQHALRLRK
jgi:phosphorylase kinase alpha/beta subunit